MIKADAMYQPTVLCTEPLSGRSPAAGDCDADGAVRRAFGAVRGWRRPPNWSPCDWQREARAIIAAAGCRADFDYDPERGVPRAAFVYKRAVASVWTRYRQEWAYALRFAAVPPKNAEEPASASRSPNENDGAKDRLLCQVLHELPALDRWLIQQLFWNRQTEGQLAATLRISQQAISKRKGRVLKQLRRACNGHVAVLSQFLVAAVAFLESLGLLPPGDFWL